MKVTKYAHACLVLELDGQKLVIDPGGYTPHFGNVHNVVGIVITHVHADHFDPAHIARILADNPDVHVWTTAEVAQQLGNPPVTIVQGGADAQAGPFAMRFFGDEHASIHDRFPQWQNVGVLVNDALYYPGDSFTVPAGESVQALALPVSAPWLKIGEAIDFVEAVHPAQCFPTHNALLSDIGQASVDDWMQPVCEKAGIRYQLLQPGQSIVL